MYKRFIWPEPRAGWPRISWSESGPRAKYSGKYMSWSWKNIHEHRSFMAKTWTKCQKRENKNTLNHIPPPPPRAFSLFNKPFRHFNCACSEDRLEKKREKNTRRLYAFSMEWNYYPQCITIVTFFLMAKGLIVSKNYWSVIDWLCWSTNPNTWNRVGPHTSSAAFAACPPRRRRVDATMDYIN